MNTLEFTLREGTLNDNVLIIPSEGYIFKGGFIAIIKEYTFLNSWSNQEIKIKFKKKESLFKYLDKHYKDLDFELSF